MSSHVRVRRQLPVAGGYPSLFTAPSAPPLVLPAFLSLAVFLALSPSLGLLLPLPRPPPRAAPRRVALSLIYYSRSGCSINCLSLRIKPAAGTRVGGQDKMRCVNQLPLPAPFPPSHTESASCRLSHHRLSLLLSSRPSARLLALCCRGTRDTI